MVQLTIQPINFFSGKIELDERGGAHLFFQVTLSCGCPTCAGGRFDPERFRVGVTLLKKGKEMGSFPARYSGKISQFECEIRGLDPGEYQIEISALDPETGSAGRLNMKVRAE